MIHASGAAGRPRVDEVLAVMTNVAAERHTRMAAPAWPRRLAAGAGAWATAGKCPRSPARAFSSPCGRRTELVSMCSTLLMLKPLECCHNPGKWPVFRPKSPLNKFLKLQKIKKL